MGGVPRQGRGPVRVRIRRRPGRIRQDQHGQRPDRPSRLGRVDRGAAHKFDPADDRQYDLVSLEELVAEKPSEETIKELHRTLAIASAIGSVCEMPAVTKFFNGNPVLGTVGGGIDAFAGRPGRKRWAEIETVIGRGWDNVVDAIDEIVTIPDVDEAASEKAEAELAEPAPEPEDDEEIAETDAERRRDRRPKRRPTSRSPTTSPTTPRAWCWAATTTSGSRSASTRCG